MMMMTVIIIILIRPTFCAQAAQAFYLLDEGSNHLRNVGQFILEHTAHKLRRHSPLHPPPCKPEISLIKTVFKKSSMKMWTGMIQLGTGSGGSVLSTATTFGCYRKRRRLSSKL
jgi:hypothetical protein